MRSGRSGTRTRMSLWVRNVQLSLFSIFPALFIGVLFKDGEEVTRYGFFTGYNWFVWTIVVLQACRGVLVALVINYSNNIAKNFATGISIVISFVASIFCFDLSITFQYLLGTCIVVGATWLYNAPERSQAHELVIEDYEKQQEMQPERGYFDLFTDSPGRPVTPLERDAYSTSSRPGSPAPERHQKRA